MTATRYTRSTLSLLAIGAALLLLGCEEQVPSPQTGRISITSTPSGARIFLDGSDTGRVTPYVTPDVPAGSHSIRLTLAGHSDWEQRDVPVFAGQITTVHAPMQSTDQPQEPDVPSERGLGLKRMDVQAYQSAHVIRADPVSLPSSVDLSVDAPSPGNQGLQGSCVGWAVAYALKTYHERIERGWPLTDDRHVMSPAYIYNQIKVPGGGAYFVDAFIVLVNEGVSSWERMPYDAFDDRSQPSARARAEAGNYRIADWGTVLRNTHQVFVQEIKRHLATGTPLVVGIPVHPDFDNLSESNPVYDDDSGAYRGAHAVVIVGYDDRRAAFKIANSWGTDWGIGGYGWIDYDASESLIQGAYVTEDVVATSDDERPGAASDPQPGSAATSVALDTVLRWTRNARTTSFDVYLGTDADLGANDFQGSVAQAEFYPHLAPGSRYYWRIDARGAGGITQGPVWTFTTAGTLEEPGKTVNPRPADGAIGVTQSTELSWDSGGRATSYDVYLGTDPVLGASELQQTQATRTYYPRGLRAGTRHYWRIDAKNGQGTTTGGVWSFTTTDSGEPGPKLAPLVRTPFDPVMLVEEGDAETINVSTHFYDPEGQALMFAVSVAPGGVVTAELAAGIITITPVAAGEATVTLTATDPDDLSVKATIVVTVAPEPEPEPEVPAGIAWRKVEPGDFPKPIGNSLTGVGWNGFRFVALEGCTRHIWHSADGFTWQATFNPLGNASTAFSDCLHDVAWNGTRFVAVGGGIVYSADGITWKVALEAPEGHRWLRGVAWNGSRFVAVGHDHPTQTVEIWHSADGITWTRSPFSATGSLSGVASNGTRFVAIGGGAIWYSADGITWTRAVGGPRGGLALAWGGNKFVAEGGDEVWHSADGITWKRVATSPQQGFRGIMWNGTRFIAWGFAGRYSYIWHSLDGIAWTQATTLVDHLQITGVAGDSTRLVATTNYGTFLTSP